MAEKEEEEKKKRRGFLGIGDLLRNKAALYALGSGFSSAAHGGNFSSGVDQGLAAWQGLEDARLNRELQELQHAQAMRSREQMQNYRQSLDDNERMLFDIAPKEYAKSKLTTEKPTSKQRDYDHLLGMGLSPKDAFNAIYGKKSTRMRLNPETGEFEMYEGYEDDGLGKPALREQEAKFGLYASQAIDADAQMTDLEKTIDPNTAGNRAYILGRETPGIGRFVEQLGTNQEMREYDTEAGRVVDGWARAMTGAAMPESERTFYKSMIGVRPGDGPEVRARKARNSRIMVESLRAASGKGEYITEQVAETARQQLRSQMTDPYQDGDKESADSGEWTDEKEQRYQELKRREMEGSLQ